MYFQFANVLVFTLFAAAFVVVNLLIARILRPRSTHEAAKVAIYECGEPTIGPAWIRFDIRFYTVALMFVVFDVEVALLFPWAAIFRDLVAEGQGVVALVEAGAFVLVLVVGLLYVWARGDIDWSATRAVSAPRAADERSRVEFDDEPGVPPDVPAPAGPAGGGDHA